VVAVIEEFCDWLAATPISEAFKNWNWFVPIVQTVHILSVAIVLTAVYIIGLRLVGVSLGKQSLATVTAKSMPWTWIALGVLLITGALLTITEPTRELLNYAFRAKMVMVLILAGILLIIQLRLRQNPGYWNESPGRRGVARALGVASLVVGASIVTAGRWIAYV
jgi:magnesium-transporting ATPase (P-type)